MDDNKGTILCFFHILHFSPPTSAFQMVGTQEDCLSKKHMIMELPNLPKAENTEFEFSNMMTLYALDILSESLPFSFILVC